MRKAFIVSELCVNHMKKIVAFEGKIENLPVRLTHPKGIQISLHMIDPKRKWKSPHREEVTIVLPEEFFIHFEEEFLLQKKRSYSLPHDKLGIQLKLKL